MTSNGQFVASPSSVASAAQFATSMGWPGIASLLSLSLLNSSSLNSSSSASLLNASGVSSAGSTSSVNNVLIPANVLPAAKKAILDSPPFVHLSKTDSAPQLKITTSTICGGGNKDSVDSKLNVQDYLSCKQGEGHYCGYRMSRASHGTSLGTYYYEVIIQQPPTAKEIASSLPSNARLGPKLQREMQEALLAELKNETSANRRLKEDDCYQNSFGSHVRLGWSMRTGDLQAPVGYDKYSYAVRSIGGSRIHCSRREDNWGGEKFGPGDVIGCLISLEGTDSDVHSLGGGTGKKNQQHSRERVNGIRFFKNGSPMGQFVITKGKKLGGVAFEIESGMYYPAISLFMGATVKVNFGPNFICKPKKIYIPAGFKPMSSLSPQPLTVEESLARVTKDKTFRKAETYQKFLELIRTEASLLIDTYENHRRKHVVDVWRERKKRNLKTDDLESDYFFLTVKHFCTGEDAKVHIQS